MTFIHPWAIVAGILAIGLPLAIHWLTRPRPQRLPLSTLRFVRQAIEQRRAQFRLRDWIILMLRAAAVLLIGWAFARPLLGAKKAGAGEAVDTLRVVLFDQSLSMSAVTHGVAEIDRVRPIAAKYISGSAASHTLRANLIFAAARPRAVFDRPSSNFAAMQDELAHAKALPQSLAAQDAINLASDMLSHAAASTHPHRELVIVSDLQRSNWASVNFAAVPSDVKIIFDPEPAVQPPANLAIVRVAAAGRAQQGREARVEIEIGNYSPAARNIDVELTVGGATYRTAGMCPPGVTTTLACNFVPQTAGWQSGEARLIGVDDALPADNVRPFVLDVRPPPLYALITRQSSSPRPVSSYFLELALAPEAAADQPHKQNKTDRVVRLSPSLVDRESLAPADLIVLDHPGKLPQPVINLLAGLMRRGRSIFYLAAEPVDAINLKMLADAAGSDLKMPVEFEPPPAAVTRHDLFLMDVRRDQPPFQILGESLPADIGPLRFGGGLVSRHIDGGLDDDILATYSDRSAALVISACAAGSLAVFNADLSDSNLPASAIFVPLVQETVDRLLSQHYGQSGWRENALASGAAATAFLPADAGTSSGLKINGPAESGDNLGSLVDDNGFVVWRWSAAGKDNAWAWLAVACAACLLAELAVLKLFRA